LDDGKPQEIPVCPFTCRQQGKAADSIPGNELPDEFHDSMKSRYCDFFCFFVDFSFFNLNFIFFLLYFHGADNWGKNYRHHEFLIF